MSEYFKNLSKIEYIVTYACTGGCIHCSEGDHAACGEHIDPSFAVRALRDVASEYEIKTVMTFGGEPLLYPDAVCDIMGAATVLGIPKRQLITNGYFTKSTERMCEVAGRLAISGVNDLLLSVDAFHQDKIPLSAVRDFALTIAALGIPVRLQPAWLVSPEDDNPYNRKTKELLASFSDTGIPIGEGNVIFPEGHALKYLAEYFRDNAPENPYREDPRNVRCISVEPNGDVLGGNLYRQDIMKIIKAYDPENI